MPPTKPRKTARTIGSTTFFAVRMVEKLTENGLELLENWPIDAVAGFRPVHRPRNQTRVEQCFQVLRNGALCQRQYVHDLPAKAGLLLGQHFQNGHPRGVAEGFGELGQLLLGFGEFGFFVGGHFLVGN